jgi:iron-sulfur cluster repair protein YtfE (RIC family)
MKATELLHRDHEEVRQLFRALERSSGSERRRELVEQLRQALDTHARIEEEIFYPDLAQNAGVAEQVMAAREEHLAMKAVLEDVWLLDPASPELLPRLQVLKESVEHHVEEEETELFPAAQRLSESHQEGIGAALAERKATMQQGVTGRLVRTVRTLIFGEDAGAAPRRKRSSRP